MNCINRKVKKQYKEMDFFQKGMPVAKAYDVTITVEEICEKIQFCGSMETYYTVTRKKVISIYTNKIKTFHNYRENIDTFSPVDSDAITNDKTGFRFLKLNKFLEKNKEYNKVNII